MKMLNGEEAFDADEAPSSAAIHAPSSAPLPQPPAPAAPTHTRPSHSYTNRVVPAAAPETPAAARAEPLRTLRSACATTTQYRL